MDKGVLKFIKLGDEPSPKIKFGDMVEKLLS